MAKQKVIIIGLDGGTYKIIDPLISQKKLPNIERLIKGGARAILKSTVPSITPAAWVTFMTGKNPGKHGFFGFQKYDIKRYDYSQNVKGSKELLHSNHFKGKTIFDLLSKEHYKVCSMAVPMTYPAWEINGYMVSGFPSPDFKEPSTYPKDWAHSIGELFDISMISSNNEEKLVNECKRLVNNIGRILLEMISKDSCDVYSAVFSSPDFVQHFLWKYHKENKGRFANAISQIYQEIDSVIGQIIRATDENTSIIILSDHGFTAAPDKYFNTNAWLRSQGYLAVSEKQAVSSRFFGFFSNFLRNKSNAYRDRIRTLIEKMPGRVQKKAYAHYFKTGQINWEETKAFRYKMESNSEGIVINRKNRQELGVVETEAEYERLRDEIIKKLIALKDNSGQKIISSVNKREDLFAGDFVKDVPDIVLTFLERYTAGVEVGGSITKTINQAAEQKISGVHDKDGILICKGPKFEAGRSIENAKMADVAPTILFDLGLGVPEDMDGQVILEAFKAPYNSERIRRESGTSAEAVSGQELSDRDEEEIEKALRGLGYLG